MKRMTGMAGLILALVSGCGAFGGGDASRDAMGMCQVPGLVAQSRPAVEGPGACGIADPIAVTRVAGVQLSRPALMRCDTARALDRWVRQGALPAVGRRGGGLVEMRVAADYSCRSRNSQRGARLSEHAKGNAIDLSAFTLADGTKVTVLEGWRGSAADRKMLRRMHSSGCGPFGTVLGPESDRFHQDHFHFDIADYRSGPYCR